jgi:hypothetical protein
MDWGWDPYKTMQLRQQDGYTSIWDGHDITAQSSYMAPGFTNASGLAAYKPPATGSIPVSTGAGPWSVIPGACH